MFEREKIKRIVSIFKYTSKTFEGRSAFFGIRFFYDLNSCKISCIISYNNLFFGRLEWFPPLKDFFLIIVIIIFDFFRFFF